MLPEDAIMQALDQEVVLGFENEKDLVNWRQRFYTCKARRMAEWKTYEDACFERGEEAGQNRFMLLTASRKGLTLVVKCSPNPYNATVLSMRPYNGKTTDTDSTIG